jgi:hypothetical protein
VADLTLFQKDTGLVSDVNHWLVVTGAGGIRATRRGSTRDSGRKRCVFDRLCVCACECVCLCVYLYLRVGVYELLCVVLILHD